MPHSSLRPDQRPERGSLGSKGRLVHGAQPMLVLTGKGEATLREGGFPKSTVIFPDLAFAAAALLANE